MNEIKQIIALAVKSDFGIDVEPIITRPDPQFGDFATNIAMQITKQVGKSSRDIAEKLAATLGKSGHIVTVAGPGFLNIHVSDEVPPMSSTFRREDRP